MPLSAICRYAELVRQGASNEHHRLALLRQHQESITAQIAALSSCLEMIDLKVELYEESVADHTVDPIWNRQAKPTSQDDRSSGQPAHRLESRQLGHRRCPVRPVRDRSPDSSASSGIASTTARRYPRAVAYYLVSEGHGPAWEQDSPRRTQDGFDEHAAFMDTLVDRGTILLGGPVGDDVDAGEALLVVVADDEDAVHAALADDPWLGTVLNITSVELWSLWLRSAALR